MREETQEAEEAMTLPLCVREPFHSGRRVVRPENLRSRSAGLCVALTFVILAFTATPALASDCPGCAPWWHLTAGARPAHLVPGTAGTEVQEIVTSEVVQFTFRVEGEELVGKAKEYFGAYANPEFFSSEPLALDEDTTPLSAENLQKGLEEKDEYGPGTVTVQETSVGANGKPLENGKMRFLISATNKKHFKKLVFGEVDDGEAEIHVLSEGKPDGEIYIDATNLGDAGANGGNVPVVVKDKLPPGVTAVEYEAISGGAGNGIGIGGGSHGRVVCELSTPGEPETTTCTFAGTEAGNPKVLPPYGQIEVRIGVDLGPQAHTGLLNHVSVSGGEAQKDISIVRPIRLAEVGEQTPFGLETYEVTPENENGTVDAQAGSHPFQTTFTIAVNQGAAFEGFTSEPEAEPAGGLIKDFKAKLPPGLIGNPTPFARCTLPEFQEETCPVGSVVGAATVVINEPTDVGLKTFHSPVFNLEPAEGEPARFGFLPTKETPIFIDASIRSGEDYGVSTVTSNIVQVAGVLRTQVTFWGTPGDVRHNSARAGCLEVPRFGQCDPNEEVHNPPPFFALPTSCPGHALESVAEADAWGSSGPPATAATSDPSVSEQPMPTLSGCNRLPFEPTLEVKPDDTFASSPTGLNVDVHVPQGGQLYGKALTQSALRETVVALPAGFALNPSASDGLEACSEGLASFEAGVGTNGFEEFNPVLEPGVSEPVFKPYIPGDIAAVGDVQAGTLPASEATLTPGQNFCPNASKIGEVTIHTPLLPATQPLKGYVYLAGQEANPFGGLLAMYIIVEDPISGSVVKLPGEVTLCKGTGEDPVNANNQPIPGVTCEALGQIVTVFKNTPQLAFEDFEAHFFGGERAPLASPTRCGAYTTQATFVPWSAEPATATSPGDEAELTVHTSSTYKVTAGPHGGPCPGAQLPVQAGVDGWRAEPAGRRVLPIHLVDDAPGRGTEHAVRRSAPTPGTLGALVKRRTVPRTTGRQRPVWPEQPDRRSDSDRRRRRRPIRGLRRQVLPHRPVQREWRL